MMKLRSTSATATNTRLFLCFATATLLHLEVNCVVESASLSNGDEDGLVIGSSDDGGKPISASWKTLLDDGGKDAISVGLVVHAFEKGEYVRVGGLGLTKAGDALDDDVRVADDPTLAVQLLRGRVVIGLGVDKVAGLEFLDFQFNRERLVLVDNLVVLREHKLARRHVAGGRDETHGGWVARAALDLLPVGDG